MSYCPEDGVVMEQVYQDNDSVCYRCPTCQSHILYAPEWIGATGYIFVEHECKFCGWQEEAGGMILEDGFHPDNHKERAEMEALRQTAEHAHRLYGEVDKDKDDG